MLCGGLGDWMDEGGASVLSLDTTQKRERCDQKLPPLQCLEHLAESIGALGGYQLKPGQVDCARDWAVVTKTTV